jgi:peptidoglycan hydrolase CwlO-like protein
MKKSILCLTAILFLVSSCVTPKIHNALVAEAENTKNALKQEEKRVIALTGELEEKSGKIIDLKAQISELRNGSLQNGKSLVALQSKYKQEPSSILASSL